MRKHQAIIDFSEFKPVINLNIIDPSIPQLYTTAETKIPARSQCFIECQLSKSPQCRVAISKLINQELFEEKGILIPKAILDPTK